MCHNPIYIIILLLVQKLYHGDKQLIPLILKRLAIVKLEISCLSMTKIVRRYFM